MWRIAWNNLKHDQVRFLTAVVGVSFAITLITVQGSIFLGAIDSSALLVRTCAADLWIVRTGALNADFSLPIPERRMYQALGVPGVARAGRMIMGFAIYSFPNGRQEPVLVVGQDDNYDWLGLEQYRDRSILSSRYVLLDRREESRFGDIGRRAMVGDRAEINGHRAEVAGIVTGRSSFISMPYVFCGYQAALNFTSIHEGQTTFVLVQCVPGADIAGVQRNLQERMANVEVLTSAQFAQRSWKYWILGTGMGMAIGLSAGLAFVVGAVIVGQTVFTSVLARLREYATLKAVGFRNRFVIGLVSLQCLAVVAVGYPLAVVATLLYARYAGRGGSAVVMKVTPQLLAVMIPTALVMCGAASIFALGKALRVAPAKVFR
jgi:putative ABC transport system permease protein